MFTLSFYNFGQQIVMKFSKNALAEFLDALIVLKAKIMEIFWTNRAIKRFSARQQKEYIMSFGATSAVTSL